LSQASFPLWSSHPAFAGLRVHLANGFYVNALTDRLLASQSHQVAHETSAASTILNF
jgi:hypothetical protein